MEVSRVDTGNCQGHLGLQEDTTCLVIHESCTINESMWFKNPFSESAKLFHISLAGVTLRIEQREMVKMFLI